MTALDSATLDSILTLTTTPTLSGPTGIVPMPPYTPPRRDRSYAARWTPRIAEAHFTAIPECFLHNLHRLRPHAGARGLNSTEALIIIQIASHKWDDRAPFPALTTIATRLGVTTRTVRAAVKRLEELGFVRRELSTTGGPSRYHLDGLHRALEALLAEDAVKHAATEEAA